jgi:hypothetical protein
MVRAVALQIIVAMSCLGCVEGGDAPSRARGRVSSPEPAPRSEERSVASWSEKSIAAEPRGWKYIVLHHSATAKGSVATIDEAHRQRRDADGDPWRGIGYHFVVGNGRGMDDGAVEPTFRWREQCDGAHAGVPPFNELGIGVCLIGNFETQQPTAAQVKSARRLVRALQDQFGIDNDRVLTHRDLKATACPGSFLSVEQILEDAGRGLARAGDSRETGAE